MLQRSLYLPISIPLSMNSAPPPIPKVPTCIQGNQSHQVTTLLSHLISSFFFFYFLCLASNSPTTSIPGRRYLLLFALYCVLSNSSSAKGSHPGRHLEFTHQTHQPGQGLFSLRRNPTAVHRSVSYFRCLPKLLDHRRFWPSRYFHPRDVASLHSPSHQCELPRPTLPYHRKPAALTIKDVGW